MKEELVKYRLAELAKEIGFDIPVRYGVYGSKMKLTEEWDKDCQQDINWNIKTKQQAHSKATSVPTQSSLQKWFRDVHNIIVQPEPYRDEIIDDDKVITQILWWDNTTDCRENPWVEEITTHTYYHSYEEALEEGLYQAGLLIKNRK